MARVIDGKAIAAEIRSEVQVSVSSLTSDTGIVPGLAVVLVGDNPASQVYVRNKQKSASEIGMNPMDIKFHQDVDSATIESKLDELNRDETVHGILVQLPLPDHLDEKSIIRRINPMKDVDGLHPENVGLLLAGTPRFVPATPAGIQELLIRTNNNPSGKHVVVCGRSDIVGKPISALLFQKDRAANATVTICHTGTKDMSAFTRQADILIAAVGMPELITSDMVSDGVVVIDVGINRKPDLSRKSGYKLVGDVEYIGVSGKASAITPVPGGVGPMTIAMLLYNTMKAAKLTAE
ncbi:MAG: bifunctional 5,10-methylenetetrahydrofolate dehydrogenase/5,10-methenyltetrahydrofolate cyclohydrolase [Dehalococcoidia bacterium]|nr:bifunctional 5,10-methylene-tetrahydrofolate dehydrogenase/5,10-methylene-tetrahydrofolate cyclohydrolase [Chloroflexota bacterium]